MLNDIWNSGEIPEDWRIAKIINIYKKGDKHDCSNYRGISILNVAYKVYSTILKRKLQPIAEKILLEEQCGFRRGRSTIDAIFTIKQIMENRREYNLPLFFLFLDYNKAYDTVDRQRLWAILKDYGIPVNLLNAIKSLYQNTSIAIWSGRQDSQGKSIRINMGLRQGCGLSPILFDLYINRILEDWKKTNPKGISLGDNRYIDSVLFADDQVLIAASEHQLQGNVTELNKILKQYNMEISHKKTKSMAVEGKHMRRCKIVIDNHIIEQVSTFKYLGSTISLHNYNMDLEENLMRYNALNGCIQRNFGKFMRKEVQLKMYNIISKPALMYGSETWVLTAQEKRRLEASQMRFMRSLLGVTLRDRIRSQVIRDGLRVRSVVEEVLEYQLKWHQHVQRMPPMRLPSQAYFYQPLGRRDVGRPRTRWKQQFQ